VVEINEIEHGPLWTPLYKNISFSAVVPVNSHASTTWHTTDTALAGEYQLKGTLNVTGNLSVTGTCSARDARGMITSKVMQTVYDAVRQEMNGQK
jgi:hypothetical protein